MTASSAGAAAFARKPLPQRFCNLDRLLHALQARGLDGIVATVPNNVFYLTGFNAVAHKSDEPRVCAVVLSRHAPDHPIIVVADYYLAAFLVQETWVQDIRPFRAVMLPLDLAATRADIDRFIPLQARGTPWIENARARYAFDMTAALKGALAELKLDRARLAFDDCGFGLRLGLEGATLADGYDPMMFARSIKTPAELDLIRRATRLNQAAIGSTVASWDKGATWRDLNIAYARSVAELGGFVRDPGGMVWGHPRGTEQTIMLATGFEDSEVEPGTHVMFDCHGTIDLYCWDGGKTWIVGRRARSRQRADLLSRPRPLAHGARADDGRRQGAGRKLDARGRHGRADPPALSGRPVRPVLVRGSGRDRPRRRQAAVLLGLRSDHRAPSLT
jgi:Xaa-Pro dipeptidase